MANITREERARRQAEAQSATSDAGFYQPALADTAASAPLHQRVAEAMAVGDIPPLVADISAPLDLNDDIARIRKMREKQPFGAFDRKLDLVPIEGYKLHWFNDKPGRIDIAMRAGWTHILDDEGKPKSLIVDSGGMKAYAMKIPQQFWDEDQARQNAKAEAALNAVKKKPDQQAGMVKPGDQGAFYTPEGKSDAATFTRS